MSSYFLVIYYQRKGSFNAGAITAFTNRLGDVGMLGVISVLMCFNLNRFNSTPLLGLAAVVILAACATKRAQMPFSAWLPAAMAAPTPVSSLVHSSTLVTAGIYILLRFRRRLPSGFLVIIFILGGLTSTMAGGAALVERDMKKLIALSTLRQLGFMLSIYGAGHPEVCFFHLFTHAFFKALLFMTAGVIIHSRRDYQDFRQISKLGGVLPFTALVAGVALSRLCGLPFLSGFYSKDIFLEFSTLNLSV